RSTPLFPYTTLFRSGGLGEDVADDLADQSLDEGHPGGGERLLQHPFEMGVVGGVGDDEHALGDGGDRVGVAVQAHAPAGAERHLDRKSTRLNSSHVK